MMQPVFDVTVDTTNVQRLADDLQQVAQRANLLGAVMAWVPVLVIRRAVQRIFASGGLQERPWRFKGYQSHPPMIMTGAMFRGLTSMESGAVISRIYPTALGASLYFGLSPGFYKAVRRRLRPRARYDIDYTAVHQHGGSRHFQNIVLWLEEQDRERLLSMVTNFLLTGVIDDPYS